MNCFVLSMTFLHCSKLIDLIHNSRNCYFYLFYLFEQMKIRLTFIQLRQNIFWSSVTKPVLKDSKLPFCVCRVSVLCIFCPLISQSIQTICQLSWSIWWCLIFFTSTSMYMDKRIKCILPSSAPISASARLRWTLS